MPPDTGASAPAIMVSACCVCAGNDQESAGGFDMKQQDSDVFTLPLPPASSLLCMSGRHTSPADTGKILFLPPGTQLPSSIKGESGYSLSRL
jgi:hypothetical protein